MTKIFLLGGHDLEMLTIKHLLEEQNIAFYDAKLEWNNAMLSAYQEQFSDEQVFYGVELKEDCQLPQHYYRIDHHNDYSGKPSSLEQVAAILGIELNRWQKLVAINDARYIPGMELLGATKEEVDSVRKADRKAQGVTEKDELNAEKAISKSLVIESVRVVRTSSSRFSPIVDRLYPTEKLLIYTDSELTYYGVGVDQVVELFRTEIASQKAYFGGGSNGFFGLAKGCFSEEEIKMNVERIVKLVKG